MLKSIILEKLFLHKKMRNFCVYEQSDIVEIVKDVLKEIKEETPHASISELFDE